MKKKITLVAFLLLFGASGLFAQGPQRDTIEVQAFTFGSSRDSVIALPSDTNRYEKILMYYTLKCDPRQNPACGEWDYLTYTNIYYPTGELDSNQLSHPSFLLDGLTPDTAIYGPQALWQYVGKYEYFQTRSALGASDTALIGNGSTTVISPLGSLGGEQNTTYLLRASELMAQGLKAGAISDLSIELGAGLHTARDLSLRLSHTSDTDLVAGVNAAQWHQVYKRNRSQATMGKLYIPFEQNFNWDGSSNILIEFTYKNYHSQSAGSALITTTKGDSTAYASSMISVGNGRAMKFDGKNDYVDAGEHGYLKGTSAFTLEGWIKIDQWKNWSKPIGKGSPVGFELGSNTGRLYAMVRTTGNTFGHTGSVLNVGDWHHIAMVFDGTQSGNANRLKIYVDGVSQSLTFGGTIPATAPLNDDPLSIGGRAGGQSFNGAADNVRIWDKALTAQEILDNMRAEDLSGHSSIADLKGHYLGSERTMFSIPNKAQSAFNALAMHGTQGSFDSEAVQAYFTQSLRPQIELIQSTYGMMSPDSAWVVDSNASFPSMLLLFADPQNPSMATDTQAVWKREYIYTKWAAGMPSDSMLVNEQNKLKLDTNYYYSAPFEVVNKIEIGRFITPYGIGLDLGPGFTWVYDLSDYAPVLHDSIRLTAGNWQELLDLRFEFIKGIPPRDPMSIEYLWGPRKSYLYKNLAADSDLKEVEVELNPNASQYKIISRITGHGHQALQGRPHCCEWADKGHYLEVDGNIQFSWSIWQTTECAANPVYPQGGTWPHARAGWCPGATVPDYEHEITDLVSPGSKVKIDYSIDPVPANNLPQGNGNYQMAWHLVSYGDANHQNDASIEQIISPNTADVYNRLNPICGNPVIEIKNTGKNIMTSARITYGPVGGNKKVYNWTGGLEFLEKQQIMLDPIDWSSWAGVNKFEVTIDQPSGQQDEYIANNTMVVPFERTEEYPDNMVIYINTNLAPQETSYKILDVFGNVVYSQGNLAPGRPYRDTLHLSAGCYKFRVDDTDGDGISYWANNDGSGVLRIWDLNRRRFIKVFDGDFGSFSEVSFTVGYALNNEVAVMDAFLELYPNPSTGVFNLNLQLNSKEQVSVDVYDLAGKLVYTERLGTMVAGMRELHLEALEPGVYNFSLKAGHQFFNKKIVIL